MEASQAYASYASVSALAFQPLKSWRECTGKPRNAGLWINSIFVIAISLKGLKDSNGGILPDAKGRATSWSIVTANRSNTWHKIRGSDCRRVGGGR